MAWRQAITWTNVGILLIGPLGTNFSEMLIEIHIFSFKKIHLKMSSGKWRPFCLGLNVLSSTQMFLMKPTLLKNLCFQFRLFIHVVHFKISIEININDRNCCNSGEIFKSHDDREFIELRMFSTYLSYTYPTAGLYISYMLHIQWPPFDCPTGWSKYFFH